MADPTTSEYMRVVINGNEFWYPNNIESQEYDCIHATAGAVLAGADEITIQRKKEGTDWNDY